MIKSKKKNYKLKRKKNYKLKSFFFMAAFKIVYKEVFPKNVYVISVIDEFSMFCGTFDLKYISLKQSL